MLGSLVESERRIQSQSHLFHRITRPFFQDLPSELNRLLIRKLVFKYMHGCRFARTCPNYLTLILVRFHLATTKVTLNEITAASDLLASRGLRKRFAQLRKKIMYEQL